MPALRAMSSSEFPDIDGWVKQCEMLEDDQPGLVTLVDKILYRVEVLALAVRVTLPCGAVGVHPSNRYGIGIKANHMQLLGQKIVKMGWSWSACKEAICMEDSLSKSCQEFTVAFQSKSDKFGKHPRTRF